jgi:hypothetical protein
MVGGLSESPVGFYRRLLASDPVPERIRTTISTDLIVVELQD